MVILIVFIQVYTTADTIVTTSINPKECFDSTLQTPTSTVHPDGVTRTYTKYGDCKLFYLIIKYKSIYYYFSSSFCVILFCVFMF